MTKTYVLLFFFVLSVPAFLGINAWQSNKCGELKREITRLEREQVELLEKNKSVVADITELLTTAKLEDDAKRQGLRKKSPEEILLIKITGGKGSDL